jgi:tryptophanyl-tRNA synthetase
MKKRLFSGIQPTGCVHIGNYFGAIKNWINLADDYESVFSIVDYHAITIEYDTKTMQERIMDAVATNIAAGLDPNKCNLFVQSHIPEHLELAWIFNSVTNIGSLERMTQFKQKSKQHEKNINSGLFIYPVLQAADIMLYKAEAVPIGDDQLQHLELTREIVRKFNHRYGNIFPECKDLVTPTPRVRGLDGEAKMSKSLNNYISLTEEADILKKKIMPAKTDENRQRRTDPGNPDICNVYSLHKLVTDKNKLAEINEGCRNASIGCVDCKKQLISNMEILIAPIREKKNELLKDKDYLSDILKTSVKNLKPIAEATIGEVKEAMGLS